MSRTYMVVSRYLVSGQGWRRDEVRLSDVDYETAARQASRIAHTLDETYGTDHFWTVDLINPDTNGSYFQLFHGRLS